MPINNVIETSNCIYIAKATELCDCPHLALYLDQDFDHETHSALESKIYEASNIR